MSRFSAHISIFDGPKSQHFNPPIYRTKRKKSKPKDAFADAISFCRTCGVLTDSDLQEMGEMLLGRIQGRKSIRHKK